MKMTPITDTLHEDQCTIMVTSRTILLKMRNSLDKICGENQNILFYVQYIFSENRAFVR